MSGNKITLNDAGIALLGNAMLFGCLTKPSELPVSSSYRREHPPAHSAYVHCRDLRDALFAAGMLDKRLAQALDTSKDPLGEMAKNTSRRLRELVGEEDDIAAVRFDDFEFPYVMSKQYQIADALEAAETIELQTPIAHLQPSGLFERVRSLVVDYAKDRAARDLGISRAKAAFIGLDGLVARREMSQPPKWHLWNSTAARRSREDAGWLQEMREKARRHVLRPLEMAYGDSSTKYDLAVLGHELERLGTSFKRSDFPVHSGLNALATHLRLDPAVSQEVLKQLFPEYGAMQEHQDYRVDADPFNVLVFMSAQVAWHAVKQGWALCVAEDGLDGGCFSWVPPDAFPQMSETGDFPLSEEMGVSGCFDLDERAKTMLGAERLWFALTDDAVAALGLTEQPEPEKPKDLEPTREYNKGFTVSDAPFVEEGLKMLEEGEAKSALNAAQLLISKYGEIIEADWTPGRKGIRSLTQGGAERRLQKAISKAWKQRRR